MASQSQCSHCATALVSGANYCSECGTPQTLMVLDRLGVEDPPPITGTDIAPHARLRMLAGLVFVGLIVVLWALNREGDPADEEPLAADPAISTTTVVTSTASTTTGAPTTTSEQLFINDARGPVLGDDVDGLLVQLIGRTMRQINLATGVVERTDLEHPVYSDDGQSGIIVNRNLVSSWRSVITITDLSDGSQREPRDITESFEMHLPGRAGVDSVWLATYPEPGGASAAIEVDLDGEVRRRVEIPQPFSVEWADGDELILGSVDGSWRYDTVTGATVRMPGAVLAFEPGLVITASCDESLQCDVLLDQGNGPEIVDWPSATELLINGSLDGSMEVSPDLSGALVHFYGEQDVEFGYIDLHTGSSVDLGHLPINTYGGVVWVEDSRWIIGQDDERGNMALAVDTETGTQVELELGRSSITSQSFLAFIPAN